MTKSNKSHQMKHLFEIFQVNMDSAKAIIEHSRANDERRKSLDAVDIMLEDLAQFDSTEVYSSDDFSTIIQCIIGLYASDHTNVEISEGVLHIQETEMTKVVVDHCIGLSAHKYDANQYCELIMDINEYFVSYINAFEMGQYLGKRMMVRKKATKSKLTFF